MFDLKLVFIYTGKWRCNYMNSILQTLKESFILDSSFEKAYLDDESYNKLYNIARDLKPGQHNPLDEYEYDSNLKKYYKKIPVQLSDSEVSQYVSLRTLEIFKDIKYESTLQNQKLNTIRKVILFWCILTVLSIVAEVIWGVYIYSIIIR
jgi:hypothetical protein